MSTASPRCPDTVRVNHAINCVVRGKRYLIQKCIGCDSSVPTVELCRVFGRDAYTPLRTLDGVQKRDFINGVYVVCYVYPVYRSDKRLLEELPMITGFHAHATVDHSALFYQPTTHHR